MRKSLILLILPLFLCSCATVNFSSKYYTLPKNYKADINEVWSEIMAKVPLKNNSYPPNKPFYSYKITKDNETQPPGVPQIRNNVISLPEYFIKYVYEFYYPKSHKNILTCTILHELAHIEANILDKPSQVHYECDRYAITMLLFTGHYNENTKLYDYTPNTSYNLNDYYQMLSVIQAYWYARKGWTRSLNIATNIASLFYGGIISDWFANDIAIRQSLFAKEFFQRTK